jgi:hypothetical protein
MPVISSVSTPELPSNALPGAVFCRTSAISCCQHDHDTDVQATGNVRVETHRPLILMPLWGSCPARFLSSLLRFLDCVCSKRIRALLIGATSRRRRVTPGTGEVRGGGAGAGGGKSLGQSAQKSPFVLI